MEHDVVGCATFGPIRLQLFSFFFVYTRSGRRGNLSVGQTQHVALSTS